MILLFDVAKLIGIDQNALLQGKQDPQTNLCKHNVVKASGESRRKQWASGQSCRGTLGGLAAEGWY